MIVFGSFARGEATADSDLDVVIVRSRDVREEDVAWRSAVGLWRNCAHRLTGNRVEVLEVGEIEIGPLLRSRKPLWLDVRREGVVVHGYGLAEMKGRRSG